MTDEHNDYEDAGPLGIVIYSDGSARPNPGFTGSGAHSYLYVQPTDKLKPTKINAWHATDKGYILTKDLEKSQAQPVTILSYLDSYEASLFEGTNNIGEINAMSLVFEHYPELIKQVKAIHILSDSKHALGGLNDWMAGWIRNNWIKSDGRPVSNKETWQRLHRHVEAYKQQGGQLSSEWVRGHNDNFGNVKADYLAGIGTNLSTTGKAGQYVKQSRAQGYHKVQVELHPLLTFKRLYFNTTAAYNTPGLYFQTNWAGPEFILGKRTSEAAFSVVSLTTPEPMVEALIEHQSKIPRDSNAVMFTKLDRLRSLDVYPWVQEHGSLCYHAEKGAVHFLDKKPMCFFTRQDELPLRAVEVMNHLEELLSAFKEDPVALAPLKDKPVNYQLHVLTDHFYERGEKKVGKNTVPTLTLKKEYGVGVKKTSVTLPLAGRTFSVNLLFQDDIPGRNTFKHLETLQPEIYAITWMESPQLIRYATLIKAEGAVGIWSNAFANQLFFNKE